VWVDFPSARIPNLSKKHNNLSHPREKLGK